MSHNKRFNVGDKFGPLTIVRCFVDCTENEIQKEIEALEDRKHTIKPDGTGEYNFLLDKVCANIHYLKQRDGYECRCKCGKTHYLSGGGLQLYKGKRKCDHPKCTVNQYKDSYERIYDDSYNIEYTNTIHGTLMILECIDENYEGKPNPGIGKRKGWVKVYKRYRCQCYLCGKEHKYKSSDFDIRSDRYGAKAELGYYSLACCDCHKLSSYEWRTARILREHNINYRIEYQFPNLKGLGGMPLRYDFAIMNADGSVKCLIECQGIQHKGPVESMGGEKGYKKQKVHDKMKYEYAINNDIKLICLDYDDNKSYAKEVKSLQESGVI